MRRPRRSWACWYSLQRFRGPVLSADPPSRTIAAIGQRYSAVPASRCEADDVKGEAKVSPRHIACSSSLVSACAFDQNRRLTSTSRLDLRTVFSLVRRPPSFRRSSLRLPLRGRWSSACGDCFSSVNKLRSKQPRKREEAGEGIHRRREKPLPRLFRRDAVNRVRIQGIRWTSLLARVSANLEERRARVVVPEDLLSGRSERLRSEGAAGNARGR